MSAYRQIYLKTLPCELGPRPTVFCYKLNLLRLRILAELHLIRNSIKKQVAGATYSRIQRESSAAAMQVCPGTEAGVTQLYILYGNACKSSRLSKGRIGGYIYIYVCIYRVYINQYELQYMYIYIHSGGPLSPYCSRQSPPEVRRKRHTTSAMC